MKMHLIIDALILDKNKEYMFKAFNPEVDMDTHVFKNWNDVCKY
jgi:hypothetical protein